MSGDQADQRRIYLDNAATSWPKPEAVYAAVDAYQRNLGAPAGRSGYAEAVTVSQAVENVRRRIARWLGLADASHLIFTANGTDSLNLVIHGLLRPGDHVVTSVAEHTSVLRPLRHWEQRGVTVTRVGCDGSGVINPRDVRAALRPTTRLVAVCHASNVTGAVQQTDEIGRIAREGGARLLCDAAQSVGHMPVDIGSLNVDYLAASGHKGLLGPLGTGLLAIRPDAADALVSVRQGGTGTRSQQAWQPDEMPSKFESGNLNVPGILGLGAGVDFLAERGAETVCREGRALAGRLLEGFGAIGGVGVFVRSTAERRVPLVSIVIEGFDPAEVALTLDSVYRIQVRPGLHCAPAMHGALNTLDAGGTVRFSLGPFTTEADVDASVQAVAEIAASQM